jgi:general secretion pathway protein H
VLTRRYLAVNKSSVRSHGFTLLEVLVVVIIIGVVISFAVLSINSDDQTLEEETRRLQALIDLTGQEAVLQSKELALQFNEHGYEFLALGDDNKWQPIADDEILRRRTLPDTVAVDYEPEGQKLTLKGADEEATPPRIYFLSSGEMTPFRLTLRRRGELDGYILTGSARGKTELRGTDDGK